jgi:hypothetical protein
MILPEVKEAKNWWGGHIWEDNVSTKKYIYAFLCYTSETFWHNTTQVEPRKCAPSTIFNPKWKGRIGFRPRILAQGKTLGFSLESKGEEFLASWQQDL